MLRKTIRYFLGCTIFLLSAGIVQAQKQGNNWYFGKNAGLSFNTSTPTILTDGMVNTTEGSAAISDADGNLLFYTDGLTIYERSHHSMPNGTGLTGNGSSTQSAIIVPQPGHDNIYYVFTVASSSSSKLDYSVVDMNLNDGYGDVVFNKKNLPVLSATEENVFAVAAGSTTWIITHGRNSNKYYAYKLTDQGLDVANPVITSIGLTTAATSDIGYFKSNVTGSKIATAFCFAGFIQVLDFNTTTGVLSGLISIPSTYAYSLEFSPNGNLLYSRGWSMPLEQYNLAAGNQAAIISSKVQLAASGGGGIQLAPNGKIYIGEQSTSFLSVIANPDIQGSGCGYTANAQSIAPKVNQWGLPTFMNTFYSAGPSEPVNANGPAGITSGLALWLDASDPNADSVAPVSGTEISTWKDKSVKHNDAVLVSEQTPAEYISNQINGVAALNFKRSSDYNGSFYNVDNLDIRASANPDVTIFSVYKPGAHAPNDFMGVWGNDNQDWDRFFLCTWGQGDNGAASLGPVNPTAADVINSGETGKTKLLTAVYDGDVSENNVGPENGSAIYFNGRLVTSFTDHTDANNAQTSFRIGYDGDNSAFNGDIAEVIVYDRKLTMCEILEINKYLAQKYGEDFNVSEISINSNKTVICPNGSVTLTATPGVSYKWLKDSVEIEDITTQNYSATTAGNYQVVVDYDGCVDTSKVTTLTTTALTAAITADGPLTFCSDKSVELTAPSGFEYEWYANGDFLYEYAQAITAHGTGAYTVKVIDNNSGCSVTTSSEDAVTVTVHDSPDASIYPEGPTKFCPGGSVLLKAAPGLEKYEWYLDDQKINGVTGDEYLAKKAGSYSMHVKSDKGCISTVVANSELSTDVTIYTSPDAKISADGPLPCIGNATLSAQEDMISYVWKLNGSVIDQTTASFQTANGGSYSLTVTDNHNCSATSSNNYLLKLNAAEDCDGDGIANSVECPQGVNCSDKDNDGMPDYMDADSDGDGRADAEEGVNDCNKNGIADYIDDKPCETGVVMPTLFTPNGDGKNDIIKPISLELKSFTGIKIFNRWGNIVFESKDITKGWDGALQGKAQPQDTYIWVATGVSLEGKPVSYKGLISLIR